MTKKLTKKEMFNQILNHLTDKDEINFIQHEIELLENKASGVRKPTANQIENDSYMNEIVELLTKADNPMTIGDIQKTSATLGELTNQRISALLKKLTDNGTVVKTYEKRKAYFSIGE